MGILKRFCRNRNHREASIQGYTAEEVVEFCTEYMKQRPIGLPLSRHEGRLKGKPVLAGTQTAAPGELAEKAHLTVLLNNPVLSAYAEEHLAEIRQSFLPMVPSSDVEMKEHTKNYVECLKNHLAQGSIDYIATWLAQKPSPTVLTYQAYVINGYTFYT